MKNPLLVNVPLDGEEVHAHLRLQTSGKYHAEWWHRGRHYFRSTKLSELGPARTKAGLMVKAVATQRLDPDLGKVLLGPAVETFLNERWPDQPAGDRTLQDYRSRLGIFCAAVGETLNLAALTYDQSVGIVQHFIAARKAKGDGERNLIHFRTNLKQFCAWLLRTRDKTSGLPMVPWRFNPCTVEEIQIGRPDEELLPALTDAEVRRFLDAAQKRVAYRFGDDVGEQRAIWRMVLLCYGAGCRAVEATRVTWGQVDFQANTITLHGKKRAREVQMSAWLQTGLRALPGEKDRDSAIVAASRARTAKQLQKLKRREKLPDHFNFQALRRTAAKRAAPLMTVQQYCLHFGHSIEVAIKHYIGWGLLGQAEATNVLTIPKRGAEKTTEAGTKKRA